MTTIDTEKTEKKVRELAYRLWEDEGRPEGRAALHWQRALEVVFATPAVEAVGAPVVPVAAKATVPAEPTPTPAAAKKVAAKGRARQSA